MIKSIEGKIVTVLFIVVVITILAFEVSKADTPFVCAVTKGEWVWMRDQPDKEGAEIGTIRYGVEGEIHEIVNGYARITTVDGREGWADVSYLLIPCKEEVWTVNTTTVLNKREIPLGRWLGEINPGARISVLGWRYDKNGELWAHVYHGGYVKACYLSRTE